MRGVATLLIGWFMLGVCRTPYNHARSMVTFDNWQSIHDYSRLNVSKRAHEYLKSSAFSTVACGRWAICAAQTMDILSAQQAIASRRACVIN